MAEVDPITREIIQNALSTAGNEMAVAMYRTAYSTIIRDCLDYSTSLCNARGEMIAQGVTLPMHVGSVPYAMETLLEKFPDNIHPRDVFVMNDPFGGGMHTPDIYIVKPIFCENQLAAFSVCTAHHLDIGGRVPGTGACDNTSVYQEGLRVPWLKLYDRGSPNETFLALLRANVRVPRLTMGDLRAQVAACHTGERAVLEIIRRYGYDTFVAVGHELIEYTERLVRAEIATWKDGSSTFTDYLDGDGVGGPAVPIKLTLTVKGDSLTADFTGTSPQVAGALNSTRSFVVSCVALCVRTVLRENVPNTAGLFRPLDVITPPGTLVNVAMPGASSMRGVTGFRVVDTVFGALAGLLPDRIFAAGEGGNSLIIIGGQERDGGHYVYYELFSGTWGGRPDRDGNDGLCNLANVASNVPIEQAECEYPVFIDRYAFVPDSGGAGRFRGGLAIEREWTLLDDEADLIIRSDRRDHTPYGLNGGQNGAACMSWMYRRKDGGQKRQPLPAMVSTRMRRGDRLYHKIAGGGGFGDPLTRDPEKVVDDVKNGKVSTEAAREMYGVVLEGPDYKVNDEATAELRRHSPA